MYLPLDIWINIKEYQLWDDDRTYRSYILTNKYVLPSSFKVRKWILLKIKLRKNPNLPYLSDLIVLRCTGCLRPLKVYNKYMEKCYTIRNNICCIFCYKYLHVELS